MGGIETNLVLLAKAFANRRHEVVGASSGGRLEHDFVAAGGRHRPISLSLSPGRFPRAVRDMSALIADERPDIVHAFSAPAALTVSGSNRLRRLRRKDAVATVSSVMGLSSSPEENKWLTRARAWLTCVGMDRVVVIAPAIDRVLQKTPVRKDHLVALPVVGVEAPEPPKPQHVQQVREELSSGSDQIVLTVGNLEPRKSHELFVAAAASIASRREDVRFFIVGEGSERTRLEHQIQVSGYEDRIVLLGERADAQDLIAAADIYVRPGIVEGFIGITVLEAQARGVPVVSFETEDVKLAIHDGVTGRLVSRGDVDGLSTTINQLLDDGPERRQLAEAGRIHVLRNFSIDAVVEGLETLYRSMVDGSSVRDPA